MNLDTLTIKVKVDSGAAERSIGRLKKKVNDLSKGQAVTDAKDLIKEREKTYKAAQAMAKKDGANANKIFAEAGRQVKAMEEEYQRAYGKTADEVAAEGNATDKAASKTHKFIKKAAGIAASVLVWKALRKAIQGVVNGIKEGVENAYQFSKATGGQLAKALDNIKSKTTAFKNSFGALLSNFIVAAEPFITQLLQKLVPIINTVSELIAKLFGLPSYLAAKDDIFVEWKANNEETRKLISGLDDLNILDSNNNTPVADMFEERETGTTALEKLKELWDDVTSWITYLWGNIKAWFTDTLAPIFTDVVETAWNNIKGKVEEEYKESDVGKVDAAVQEIDNNKAFNIVRSILAPWNIPAQIIGKKGFWAENANGGVYTRPTLGLVGEYAGAASNPEIISPKKLMAETIAEQNGELASVFAQVGRQIVMAIADKDMTVNVGDNAVGSASARYNQSTYRATGKPAMV